MINAISKTLDSLFPGIPIENREVKQGFDGPCFFILRLHGGKKNLISDRAVRSASYDVHYFPADGELAEDKIDALYDALEEIQDGADIYRAVKISDEISSGVLHMIATYKYTTVKTSDGGDLMQSIAVTNA